MAPALLTVFSAFCSGTSLGFPISPFLFSPLSSSPPPLFFFLSQPLHENQGSHYAAATKWLLLKSTGTALTLQPVTRPRVFTVLKAFVLYTLSGWRQAMQGAHSKLILHQEVDEGKGRHLIIDPQFVCREFWNVFMHMFVLVCLFVCVFCFFFPPS